MAQQTVFTVLDRGAGIAVDEAKYLLDVSEKVESAKKQLMHMKAFLKDLDDWMLRGGGAMARNLVSEVREVAYEVEDIIDAANIMTRQSDPKTTITGAICKYACFPIYLIHLHKLGERIDVANIRLKIIFEDFEKFKIPDATIAEESRGYMTEDDTIQHWRSVHPDFGKPVDVIGFDYQTEQIKGDLLDKGNMHLTVVSIVGPGGAGKSTIAKKVYGLAAVRRNFKVRTWIIVPQRFVPSDLLKEMVKRLVPHDLLNEMIKRTMEVVWLEKGIKLEDMAEQEVKLEEMNMQEVKILLCNFALNERYLVVLDDLWNTDAWDIITAAFPDKKNGSRVILTTRNEVVAQHPNARKKIYVPKLLNEKESTRLLLRTALPEYIVNGSNNSPGVMGQNLSELKKLGKDLAAKCSGLPLAIVVLGGHLSRNVDVVEWKRLQSSMDLITTDRIIGAILDLSYYDMPSHLRSCFLYTTAFPKDSHIDVRVLAMLWVAEGFIPLVRGHTREKLALNYVNELVQRCMIQVEKRASSGRIKVIKVHDILRNWGIGLARREGLVKDCHDTEDIESTYSEEVMKSYRMVLHGSSVTEVGTSMRKLRTLLDFTLCFENPRVQVAKFQGLRVLYLHCSGRILLPREIGRMRYLRYLGLGGNCIYFLPSSIGDLLSLETLYATASIDHIPSMLWEIPTLRQVHVLHARNLLVPHINPQSKVHVMVLSKSGEWNGLSKSVEMDGISTIDEWDGPSKQIMEATKCRVLKNNNPDLSCCFGMTYSMNDMDIMGRCKRELHLPNEVPDFEEMHDITSLKICCANLLSNEEKMLELGMMRLLTVLEIGERSYTGSLITCPSGSFRSLEELVLHDLPFKDWKIEHGSMARLRKLVLCKCPNLSYLPEGLLWLPHLTKLELIAMHKSCNQQDTVAQKLEKKGCVVLISFNEKDFQHLNLPISASKST